MFAAAVRSQIDRYNRARVEATNKIHMNRHRTADNNDYLHVYCSSHATLPELQAAVATENAPITWHFSFFCIDAKLDTVDDYDYYDKVEIGFPIHKIEKPNVIMAPAPKRQRRSVCLRY